jgi:hypothetical protein
MKILVMGLPGSGKTTLAESLAFELQAIHFNADDIRKNINKDLGFSPEDRVEQARRMGHLCNIVSKYGAHVIADFVCPTPKCRDVFNPDFVVWVDRIKESMFEDTNKMFVPPEKFNYRVTADLDSSRYHAEKIKQLIKP